MRIGFKRFSVEKSSEFRVQGLKVLGLGVEGLYARRVQEV